MTQEIYRNHAKDLIKKVSELQKQVLLKHTTAILEEMHDQLAKRDAEVQKLKDENELMRSYMKRHYKGPVQPRSQIPTVWDQLIEDYPYMNESNQSQHTDGKE